MGKYNIVLTTNSERPQEDGMQVFTNEDIISGTIDLQILKQTDIKSISVSIVGISAATYTRRRGQLNAVANGSELLTDNRRIYKEYHNFLTVSQKVFPLQDFTSGTGAYAFVEGSDHRYNFELQIPSRTNCDSCITGGSLPASLPRISDAMSSARVTYEVKVNVIASGIFNNKEVAKVFKFRPTVSGNINELLKPMTYNKCLLYEKKVKRLIDSDDPSNVNPVQNPIDDDHKYTRFFRGIFNEHYKDDNYFKLVGDVPLQVAARMKSRAMYPGELINSNTPYVEFALGSNIKSLQPDYILRNNESSGLGEFIIKKVKITINQHTYISARGYHRTIQKEYVLYKSSEPIDYKFDLALFDTNHLQQLIKRVPGRHLFTDSESFNSIKVPGNLIPNFSSCGNIKRYYDMEIELGVAKDTKSKPRKFKFGQNIVILGYTTDSDKAEPYNPLPAYELYGQHAAPEYGAGDDEGIEAYPVDPKTEDVYIDEKSEPPLYQ